MLEQCWLIRNWLAIWKMEWLHFAESQPQKWFTEKRSAKNIKLLTTFYTNISVIIHYYKLHKLPRSFYESLHSYVHYGQCSRYTAYYTIKLCKINARYSFQGTVPQFLLNLRLETNFFLSFRSDIPHTSFHGFIGEKKNIEELLIHISDSPMDEWKRSWWERLWKVYRS